MDQDVSAFVSNPSAYDEWFLANPRTLHSELNLLARALGPNCGKVLSIGCGSGLFEMLLQKIHGIPVKYGVEPSSAMAELAVGRGMEVKIGVAESLPFDGPAFDTALFNGTPSYISDLGRAIREASRVLLPEGRVVMLDVPKESSFGLIYNLACTLGSWNHPLLHGISPYRPYPVEFARSANWRTTEEKIRLLEAAGFLVLGTSQTLTRHPFYAELSVEEPVEGHDRGDYVAIVARKASF